jgi:alanine-synthesizing transaminase
MSWEYDNILSKLYALKREALAEGKDLIDLSMINPDIAPPRLLQDKLVEAINRGGSHRYSSSRGVKKLREGFAERYKRGFQVTVDPESEICVTLGTKDGVLHALSAITQMPGISSSVVLVGRPTYPAYRFAAEYLGLSLLTFDVMQDEAGILKDIDALAQQVGGNCPLLLNFPHNPTGKTVSAHFYTELGKLAEQRSLYVVNDFTYGEMMYNGKPAASILQNDYLKKRAVETYGLSKAFSVPGWRVGALLGSREIVEKVSTLKSRVDFGTFLPLQFAAVSALQSGMEVVRGITEFYSRRSRYFCNELLSQGWTLAEPDNGCCVWAQMPKGFNDCGAMAEKFLSVGVAALPGSTFGPEYGSFMRFALVTPEPQLREVAERIAHLFEIKEELKNSAFQSEEQRGAA